MGFSSECLYCFHYPDSLGYLIFCCHGVAMKNAKSYIYQQASAYFLTYKSRIFLNVEARIKYKSPRLRVIAT